MWRIVLSDPLRVIALVSRYLTNKLIRRDPSSGESMQAEAPFGLFLRRKKDIMRY